MSHTKRLIAVTATTLLLFVGCSKKKDEPVAASGTSATTAETAATTVAPTTAATRRTATTKAVDASKDEERAKAALIGASDLPPGEWSGGGIESSAGEGGESSTNFTDVESCEELVDDKEAIEAKSSGRASIRFSRGADGEIQLGHDVELWPSADTVKQIGKITDDPGFQECMTDALAGEMFGGQPTPTEVRVTAFNVGIDADEVGVDFITGVNVRFVLDLSELGVKSEGSMRFVFIGAGRGLATVSLIASPVAGMSDSGSVDPESIDLTKTVEAAAEKLAKAVEGR